MKLDVGLVLSTLGLLSYVPIARGDAFLYSNGSFTDINVPGANRIVATSINNAGQIAGYYFVPSGDLFVAQPFLDTNGVVTTIPNPFEGNVLPTGINNVNQIVGYQDGGGFLDTNGVFMSIEFPGSYDNGLPTTFPGGINDLGQIVGTYHPSPIQEVQGFLDSNGVYTTISVPGSSFTTLNGINNTGQIIGQSHFGSFVKTNDTFTTIQVPGSTTTVALGINNSGEIVGYYQRVGATGFLETHGFLDIGGVISTFDVPGSADTELHGINDTGEIVGSFVPTPPPIPEPGSFVLVGGGLIALISLIKRKATSGERRIQLAPISNGATPSMVPTSSSN